jgi:hypothetical protein
VSGKVISGPNAGHQCYPGYEMRTYQPPSASMSPDAVIPADSESYLSEPSIWSHPKGTVWQCDDCGQTWVARGDLYRNMRGPVRFSPETWWERRRRTRREPPCPT